MSAVAYVATVDPTTHAPQPGGALTIQGCTVVGKVYVSLLSLASDCIFWAELSPSDTWSAALWASRKQQGCVRFSYLPAGAITPRQFECVASKLSASRSLCFTPCATVTLDMRSSCPGLIMPFAAVLTTAAKWEPFIFFLGLSGRRTCAFVCRNIYQWDWNSEFSTRIRPV